MDEVMEGVAALALVQVINFEPSPLRIFPLIRLLPRGRNISGPVRAVLIWRDKMMARSKHVMEETRSLPGSPWSLTWRESMRAVWSPAFFKNAGKHWIRWSDGKKASMARRFPPHLDVLFSYGFWLLKCFASQHTDVSFVYLLHVHRIVELADRCGQKIENPSWPF